MAHLWMLDDEEEWGFFPLAGEEVSLGKIPPSPPDATSKTKLSEKPLLLRARDDSWVLLCGDDGRVQINGLPPAAGVRALRHKDRIQVQGVGTVFLSTENLPQVEPFPGAKARGQCPRCCKPIAEGSPAVCCPGCGVWYHQSDDYPCFSLAPTCIFCPQETDLEAGFRFVPEAL